MKIRRLLIIFVTALLATGLEAGTVCAREKKEKTQTFDAERQLEYCHSQIKRALSLLRDSEGNYDFTLEPRNILASDSGKGWNCREARAEEWCSGFWPGILWMDYSVSHDKEVLRAARGYTQALRPIAYRPCYDHDIGFLMFCSFGKGYEVCPSKDYREVILASADSLATLFNPLVGTILSWPREVDRQGWPHNTIMDNMMNLDMMFWASRNGGNPLLYDIALAHAKTTLRNHFREDGSCYHVAVYDTLSGDFIKGVTHQGYSDGSMWARGQAWAIYGYTMVYRYTGKRLFLDFAQKVTDVYLRRLHETSDDLVPLWDMDDPRGFSGAPKDASAACIVADALLELCNYVDGEKAKNYRDAALGMLTVLSGERYQSGERNVSFLLHSTGHHPAGSEIDASIIYADYYYLEALLRACPKKRSAALCF